MKIPRHVLAQAIAERTLHVTDKKLLAREIAAYLLVENRTGELESILRDIMQRRIEHGVLEAEVVTAHDIQPHVLHEIEQLLHAAYPKTTSIQLSQRQDPTVIGGVRIDMPNQQLDLSVAAKLAKFKTLIGSEGDL